MERPHSSHLAMQMTGWLNDWPKVEGQGASCSSSINVDQGPSHRRCCLDPVRQVPEEPHGEEICLNLLPSACSKAHQKVT